MTRELAGHLLQTTALVNKAYLQLVDARKVKWRDRGRDWDLAKKWLFREMSHATIE